LGTLVLKVPLPLTEFVQTGVHVLRGAATFVLVNRYSVPAPEFVWENERLFPEIVR
jgi:hypothetical protein